MGGLRLRLLTPADEPLVRTGFTGLTSASRHLRYGIPIRDADRALGWVRLLGDGTHVALGACSETGQPIGVARYVRKRGRAEVAVTVVDAWQGRGAGTLLLAALCAHARRARVSAFQASVLAENMRALRLAERFGARRSRWDGGWIEYALALGDPQTCRPPGLPEDQRVRA
jgi:RimJ/RimL family protein N-acetyltransferase